MALRMEPLSETMSRPRSISNSSDGMDDQDYYTFGSSTSSSSGDSPKIHSAESASPPTSSFDLSYLLSLANPDLSSSSSESQSQGSRAGSPSDWQSGIWPDLSSSGAGPWKWQPDPLTSESAIDPSSLHFASLIPDTEMFSQPALDSFSLDSIPSFTFTDTSIQPQFVAEQPIHYSAPVVPAPYPSRSLPPGLEATPQNNNYDEMGRRAREAAGIQYAIPLSASTTSQPPPSLSQTLASSTQLTPQFAQEASSYPVSSMTSAAAPSLVITAPPSGRPKTSHTTIERRYRTNLNARIVALRHAVPALRILDKTQFPDEKVDERGYVDGVKAARKASKGNILGKAAEYIQ